VVEVEEQVKERVQEHRRGGAGADVGQDVEVEVEVVSGSRIQCPLLEQHSKMAVSLLLPLAGEDRSCSPGSGRQDGGRAP